MRRIALIVGLFAIFSSIFSTKIEAAACVSPVAPAYTSCPASNPFSCYATNDSGVEQLTCCATADECSPAPVEGAGTDPLAEVCVYAGDKKDDCKDCAINDKGVWTAIGCIPTTPQGLFTKFFPIGIGMAGGIAFLLILFGGFQILTSAGNPEQLNEGRELVSSSVAGLLLIIFSVFLLRLIGYDILRIPGFTP